MSILLTLTERRHILTASLGISKRDGKDISPARVIAEFAMKYILLCSIAVCLTASATQADPRQWAESGIALRQPRSVEFWGAGQTAFDPAGYVLITWTDQRSGNRDVYAQLLNSNGVAHWDVGGRVITDEIHQQSAPAAIAVDGGYVIAWVDYRSQRYQDPYPELGGDIRVQKLSRTGERLWSADNFTGVPVDVSNYSVSYEITGMVDDGAGGAFVVWGDRNANGDDGIAVQRILTDGSTYFQETLRIAGDGSQRSVPLVCTGDSGSVVICWLSMEAGDIYARVTKVLPNGTFAWGESGVLAFASSDFHADPVLCSDGLGGCYVSVRDGSDDLRVQHLDGNGDRLWAANGFIVSMGALYGSGSYSIITPSFDNGAPDGCLIGAMVPSNEPQYPAHCIQKIRLDGSSAWGSEGVPVCDLADDAWEMQIASDSSGGAVIARYELAGQGNSGCKVSYFDSQGNSVWPVCEMFSFVGRYVQPDQPIYVTAELNRIFVTGGEYVGSGGDIQACAQVMNLATGARTVGDSGIVVAPDIGGEASLSLVLRLEPNRILILWDDSREDAEGVYFQIMYQDGSIERMEQGELLIPASAISQSDGPWVQSACPDGSGGAFISTTTRHVVGQTSHYLVSLLRMDNGGNIIGPDSGVVVDTDSSTISRVVADGSGGCFIAWQDGYASQARTTYVQRYSASLEPMWTLPIQVDNAYLQDMITGLPGQSHLMTRTAEGVVHSMQLMGIGLMGETSYLTVVLDSIAGNQGYGGFSIVPDREGGVYIGWTDQRFGGVNHSDVFAQHVTASGVELWEHNGLPVWRDEPTQNSPVLAVDSENHLYLVWSENRFNDSEYDLYAQRIRPNGEFCWGDSGLALIESPYYENRIQTVVDAHDHLTVVWERGAGDYNDDHLFATQIDSLGTPTDPHWVEGSGGPVGDTLSRTYSYEPSILADEGGEVYVFYSRYPTGGLPSGSTALYGQLLADRVLAAEPPLESVTRELVLHPAFPNPFNSRTELRFSLRESARIKLRVFDVLGREVATLSDELRSAGEHRIMWDASRMATGIYFCRLESAHQQATQKILLLR